MKSLFEIHISFLAPEEAVITVTGSSQEEVEATVRATLDKVQELKIISVKNLGEVPEDTQIDSSAEASAPVDPSKLN